MEYVNTSTEDADLVAKTKNMSIRNTLMPQTNRYPENAAPLGAPASVPAKLTMLAEVIRSILVPPPHAQNGGPMNTQSCSENNKYLSQREMLRRILRDIVFRDEIVFGLVFLQTVLLACAAILESLSNYGQQRIGYFGFLALWMVSTSYLRDIAQNSGQATPMRLYAQLPIMPRTLALGILGVHTGFMLVGTAVVYLFYRTLTPSPAYSFMEWLAIFVALTGGMLVIPALVAWTKRMLPSERFHPATRLRAARAASAVGWLVVLLVIIQTLDVGAASPLDPLFKFTHPLLNEVASGGMPILWPRGIVLGLSGWALLFAFRHPESIVFPEIITVQQAGPTPRLQRPTFRFMPMLRWFGVVQVPRFSIVIIYFAVFGLSNNNAFVLSFAVYGLYWGVLFDLLLQMRGLRTLPVSTARITAVLCIKPLLYAAAFTLFLVIPLGRWLFGLSPVDALMMSAAACIAAHLAALVEIGCVREFSSSRPVTAILGILLLGLMLLIGGLARPMPLFNLAMVFILLGGVIAVAIWLLHWVIDRSSLTYRNRENEVEA